MKRGFVLLLLLVSVVTILASLLQASSDADKVDNAVYEKLRQDEKVRVIVRLYDEPIKAGLLAAKETPKKEDVISSVSAVGEDKFELAYKAESVNGFTAEISQEALEKLRKDPAVKYIKVEREYNLLLQDSIPMVNATLVLPKQVIGTNITGNGQTVCLVDTGINYTHNDLGGCLGMDCRVMGGFAFQNPFNSSNNTDIMDDNGHGTHVAGIIGANGTITGVAPGVGFVAVKVCGPSSSCGTQAIIDGINWCAGNYSRYNISVISMSIGGGLFTSYCDSDDADMTAAVDGAVARNITVVVASGNDGSTTQISSPGCIHNSTAVGAVSKGDIVNYNRNNITVVLAPGVNINSTARTGSYELKSGTSMATPHVSGAVALLKQYKKLENNKNLTTATLKDVLNRTGRYLNDSTSGLNLSRLVIFAALVDIDESAPQLNITHPQNVTYTSNTSLPLNFSATDNLNLSNCWYSIDGQNTTLASCTNTTLNTTRSSHTFRLYANDSAGNENWTSSIIFSVDITPVIGLVSPSNNTYTINKLVIFQCNATDDLNITNITLNLWNATSQRIHTNTTNVSGTYNSTNSSYELPYKGVFKWNCRASDNSSNIAVANNYTLTYMNITLQSPLNGTNYTLTDNVTFIFNASIDNIANCSLIVNGVNNRTNISTVTKGQNHSLFFALTNIINTPYNWSINCTDASNNVESSETRQLYVNGYNLTHCNRIISAGNYYLNNDLNDTSNVTSVDPFRYTGDTPTFLCINITTSDVRFDCQGYTLNGTDIITSSPLGESWEIIASGSINQKLTNISVTNCNIKNAVYGIFFSYIENSSIISNNITVVSNAINFSYSSNNLIDNNRLSSIDANLYGALIGISNSSSNNIISDNNLSNHPRSALNLYQSNNNTIKNNLIYNAGLKTILGWHFRTGGIMIYASSLTNISNNTVYNITGAGISVNPFDAFVVGSALWGCNYGDNCNSTTTFIYDNNVTNTTDGIQIGYAQSINATLFGTIKNNIVSKTAECAINLYSKHYLVVNNTLTSNYQGICVNENGVNNTILNTTQSGTLDYDLNMTSTMAFISWVRSRWVGSYYVYNTTLTLANTSYAVIHFPNITQNGTNLTADVIMRNNYVYINSSNAPGLNRTANITLLNLGLNNPRILRDNAVCPSSICTRITYNSSNGSLIFNVTGFSAYSSEDYCGNSHCEGLESCSSCSADCGACPISVSTGGGGGGGVASLYSTYSAGDITNKIDGISRELAKKDRLEFNISESKHTLLAKSLGNAEATFELNSSSEIFTLAVNESRKFNTSNEIAYDLSITLNKISNSKANVTLKAISEQIPLPKRELANVSNATQQETRIKPLQEQVVTHEQPKRESSFLWIWVSILIAVFIFLVYYSLKTSKRKGRAKKRAKIKIKRY